MPITRHETAMEPLSTPIEGILRVSSQKVRSNLVSSSMQHHHVLLTSRFNMTAWHS
jgi:hypothetical protein